MADRANTNRRFYDALWRETPLVRPERFNTWPMVQRLVDTRGALEVGPGLRPRLPLHAAVFVDASPPAVASLRSGGARAIVGDASRLPFRDGSFSVVAAFDIVEHVADDRPVFDELARVLAPRGHLLLSVPLHPGAWTEFDTFVGHYRRYDPSELERALARRDLRVIESAVYGMQPTNRHVLAIGMWMLRHQRRFAMRWYNAYMPFALWLQKPLRFAPGLADDRGVDEIIAVCRREA